ncbi:MAG: flagellar basal body L-ring protein FlgH [Deltaproteobacteria bacterium]|jgi:flagellar L-ring protein precursor FlgH|nr:flagellar basal body L-ring protein FlgH [Deltaproteobacteria bacterium]
MPASRTFAAACLLGALALQGGCNATHEKPAVMPPITPAQTYVEPETKYHNPGSIYNEGDADGLFADARARRVGDIIMVNIVDTMRARNKADLTVNKDVTNRYGVNAYARVGDINYLGQGGYTGRGGPGLVFDTSSNSDNTSKGETNRENIVTATVAARVVRLLPGGAMQIEGARETRVNNETQYLVVRGIIRSVDVAADNSVTSNRIADAHIAYYGEGVIADKTKPGWLTRLLDNFWPF